MNNSKAQMVSFDRVISRLADFNLAPCPVLVIYCNKLLGSNGRGSDLLLF